MECASINSNVFMVAIRRILKNGFVIAHHLVAYHSLVFFFSISEPYVLCSARQGACDVFRPFNQDDILGILQYGIEPQRTGVICLAQPIRVHMVRIREVRMPDPISFHDHKRRTRDSFGNTQRSKKPLGKRRLSGAKIAAQRNNKRPPSLPLK